MKKFISAFLLMAAMAFSVSTFVSCNDLTEEMEKVTTTANENAKAIKELGDELRDRLAKAEQAIADAKTEAAAAAATAEANAIKKAQELVNALEKTVADNYATKKELQDAVDVIKASLGDLDTKLDDEVEKLLAKIGEINTQIEALETYNTTQDTKIQEVADNLAAAKTEILNKLAAEKTALMALIDGNAAAIKTNADAIKSLNDELDALKLRVKANEEAIDALEERMDKAEADIKKINEDLVTLNKLVYGILKGLAYVPHTIDTDLNEIEAGFFTIMRDREETHAGYTHTYGVKPYDAVANENPVLYNLAKHEFVDGNCVEMTYRVDPADADLTEYELSFLGIDVITKAQADADAENALKLAEGIEGVDPVKKDGKGAGRYTITVKAGKDLKGQNWEGYVMENGKPVHERVALKAEKALEDGTKYTIVSDYVAVADYDLYNYSIRNKYNRTELEEETWPEFFQTCWWKDKTLNAKGEANGIDGLYDSHANYQFYPGAQTTGNTTSTYNQAIGTKQVTVTNNAGATTTTQIDATPVKLPYKTSINLLDYVETYCERLDQIDGIGILDNKFPCLPVTYDFALVDEFIGADGVTNQQEFVVLNGSTLSVSPNGLIEPSVGSKVVAIGKTPVVMVTAKVSGQAIAKAYIKVDIVEVPTEVPDIKLPRENYTYCELVSGTSGAGYDFTFTGTPSATNFVIANSPYKSKTAQRIDWARLTNEALAKEGVYMSNEQFIQVYMTRDDVAEIAGTPLYDVTGKYTKVWKYNAQTKSYVEDPTLANTAINGDWYKVSDEDMGQTTTAWVGYSLNSLVHEKSEGEITFVLKPNANFTQFYPELKIIFQFAVNHTPRFPEFNDEYTAVEALGTVATVKGHQIDGSTGFNWTFEHRLHESFEESTYNYACDGNKVVAPHHTAYALKIDADRMKESWYKANVSSDPDKYKAAMHAYLYNTSDTDKNHGIPGAPAYDPSDYTEHEWQQIKIALSINGYPVDNAPAGSVNDAILENFHNGGINTATGKYEAAYLFSATDKADYLKAGELIQATATTKAEEDLIWPADNQFEVPVTLYTKLDNGNWCELDYYVRYVNPFEVTLANAELETLTYGVRHNIMAGDVTYYLDNEVVCAYDEVDGMVVSAEAEARGIVDPDYFTEIYDYSLISKNATGVNGIEPNIAKGVNETEWPVAGDPDEGDAEYEWLHWTQKGMLYWNNGGTVLRIPDTVDAVFYGYTEHVGWFKAQPVEGAKPTVTILAGNLNKK